MKKENAAKNAVYIGMFAALIIMGAFIKIPVPVIPFTLQFLFVALAGLLLGAKSGALSVIVYVALGLAGLPVFTGGGGIGYVLFPTFGYLIGFIFCAFVTGLVGSKSQSIKNFTLAAFSGLLALHLIGIPYYYLITKYIIKSDMTFGKIFLFCFCYTVPADFLLSVFAARIALRLKPILNRG